MLESDCGKLLHKEQLSHFFIYPNCTVIIFRKVVVQRDVNLDFRIIINKIFNPTKGV